MRKYLHFPNHTIFRKILFTFLGLLLPLVTLNLLMNESGSNMVREEIVQSLDGKVGLYMDLIESDFDRVITLLSQYVNDGDLLKLSTASGVMSEAEKTESILALKHKIDLVQTTSRFVKKATVFIPALNRSITSRDNYVAPFDPEQFDAFAMKNFGSYSLIHYWDGSLFLSVPYPDPAAGKGREQAFLLAIEVSEEAIRDMLRQFSANGERAVFASNSHPWRVLSEDGMDDVADALAEGAADEAHSLELDGERIWVVSQTSERLGMTLSVLLPEERAFGPLARYRTWLWMLSAASVAIVVFFALSIHRMIQRPLRMLVHSLNQVEKGNLKFSVTYRWKDEFGILFNRFNSMVKQLNVLVHEVFEQKYRLRLSELRQLQSQINPHFLYNSFFLLHRMAKREDLENIERFTKYLGTYFQFITRDGENDVALEKEVENARMYAEIQGFRFGSRIRCNFEPLPAEWSNVRVPRLILQPILENAYEHGLERKTKDGLLEVRFLDEDGFLTIRVEDNGEHIDEARVRELRNMLLEPESASAQNTGLLNVHRRLRMKFGPPFGLELSIGTAGGLRVDIRIPFESEAHGNDVPTVDR